MEYSRVGVPLKTGRSFVSPSYSQEERRGGGEGGDFQFFLLRLNIALVAFLL